MEKVNDIDLLKIINYKKQLIRLIVFMIGLLIMAISFNLFLLPNEIVYGGIGGLSITIKKLLNIEPAIFILISNIVLLIINFIIMGKKIASKSIIGSLLFPLFIKVTTDINYLIMIDSENTLLMAIFGGLLIGIGLGLTIKAGLTTGGTDIINQIIHKLFKVSVTNAIIITDGLIILGSIPIIGIEKAMYGIIVLYIFGTIADRVVLGISKNKTFYIVTSKEKEIKEFLLNNLNTGVTILNSSGGFTGKKQKVLMCIIPTRDYFKIKEGIHEIDKDSFFVVTDSYEVIGGKTKGDSK